MRADIRIRAALELRLNLLDKERPITRDAAADVVSDLIDTIEFLLDEIDRLETENMYLDDEVCSLTPITEAAQ